jgi:alkylated DNA repair protein (DNA oxidative demethylase)
VTLTLFESDGDGQPVHVAPGAVHVPGWLTAEQQRWIVGQFRQWASGPVPLRSASIHGHQMSAQTVCLGWHWQPYRYTRLATDVNNRPVLPFPDWLVRLGRRALRETGYGTDDVVAYTPDTALVNFYDDDARMGMHQDKDERSRAPVVSLSIGDACTFRFGNTENRSRPYTDVRLGSGDLFVFGGPARLAFHGVTRIHADTAPPGCGLDHGRINLTVRMTGLTSL